jgi:hypothetical protein
VKRKITIIGVEGVERGLPSALFMSNELPLALLETSFVKLLTMALVSLSVEPHRGKLS